MVLKAQAPMLGAPGPLLLVNELDSYGSAAFSRSDGTPLRARFGYGARKHCPP